MAALGNPFSNQALGACIPRFPAVRSQKLALTARFLASTSSTGNGFIHIMPCLANDGIAAHYSNSTWTGTAASNGMALGDAGTSSAALNSPYATASFSGQGSSNVRGRVLSVGVRLTPVTAAQSLGGLVSIYVDPSHNDVNELSGTAINNRPTTSIMRPNPRGHVAVAGGVNDTELEYSGTVASAANITYPFSNGAYSSTDTTTGAAILKIFFYGGSSSQVFWVEIIEHVEFIGPLVGPAGTPSHVDPIGFAAVNAAAQEVPQTLAGSAYEPESYMRAMINKVKSTLGSFTHEDAAVAYNTYSALRGIGGLGARQIGGMALEY